jgi:ssDNA-binding Zn-finger/Zn-ribbon topoisomerase 1
MNETKWAIGQAIEGLKNLKLFMELEDKTNENEFSSATYESVDMGIKALEKQVTKKPIRNGKCTCPRCETHNEVIKKRRNTVPFDTVYCWHCGQAIEIKRGGEE